MAFNRPTHGPRAGRRPRPRRRCTLRDYRKQLGVGAAGELPVRRHHRREHRLRQPARDASTRSSRRAASPTATSSSAVPARLRHRRRRARHQALGRAAAARGDCPRHPGRPAHPDPRRGDLEPRQRERGDDPGRPAALRSGRTTFVIAHRLSTIRSADQILVLEARRDRRARHARPSCSRSTAATVSSTTSSTSSRPTASSIRARTSRRSRPRPRPCARPPRPSEVMPGTFRRVARYCVATREAILNGDQLWSSSCAASSADPGASVRARATRFLAGRGGFLERQHGDGRGRRRLGHLRQPAQIRPSAAGSPGAGPTRRRPCPTRIPGRLPPTLTTTTPLPVATDPPGWWRRRSWPRVVRLAISAASADGDIARRRTRRSSWSTRGRPASPSLVEGELQSAASRSPRSWPA